MKKQTLEQILRDESESVTNYGPYGIEECKASIQWKVDYFGVSLYELLEQFVIRANTDCFFNKRMVYACWQMINAQVV